MGLLRAVVGRGRVAAAARHGVHCVLGHVTPVRRLHVALHLVRLQELLRTHRAPIYVARFERVVRKHVGLVTFFALERFRFIPLEAFRALIGAPLLPGAWRTCRCDD